jgi:hypothetical protein
MLLLEVILWVTAALLAAALGLWGVLLGFHAWEERRDKRHAAMGDVWLGRLLPVLDGEIEVASLPKVGSREELDVVLALLRELLERFRGSYRDRLGLVLRGVGAELHGLQLLKHRAPHERVRGVALLAWCDADLQVDRALDAALEDRDPRVRLEAADALVRRGAVREIGRLLVALGKGGAGRSLRARDLFRRWGAATPGMEWSLWLARDWPEDARVLLLEAASASGTCDAGAFCQQAGHPAARVAALALHALESAADPDGAGAARVASADPRDPVRLQATRTLGACGGTADDIGRLLELLGDTSFEVCKAAFDALRQAGAESRLRDHQPVGRWQSELFREAGFAAREVA